MLTWLWAAVLLFHGFHSAAWRFTCWLDLHTLVESNAVTLILMLHLVVGTQLAQDVLRSIYPHNHMARGRWLRMKMAMLTHVAKCAVLVMFLSSSVSGATWAGMVWHGEDHWLQVVRRVIVNFQWVNNTQSCGCVDVLSPPTHSNWHQTKQVASFFLQRPDRANNCVPVLGSKMTAAKRTCWLEPNLPSPTTPATP